MLINEDFIHYLWKFRLLSHELMTEGGESVEVLHPGQQNSDGGPDFFNARIRIGGTIWAGNVEIHILASDWFRHGHHNDPAYDNTVLHVVYEADKMVTTANGHAPPTLEVQNHFSAALLVTYRQIMEAKEWVPCISHLKEQAGPGLYFWSVALAVDRLEKKSNVIRHLFRSCGGDWEETYYRQLAVCFGFKINALPFELLAKSLPLKHLRAGSNNLFRLEALLFGQAGMLSQKFDEPYPEQLAEEYLFLRGKYRLDPIPHGTWKYLRLRPANFPTIRISQFARFIHQTQGNFLGLLEYRNIKDVCEAFNVDASGYWDTHFVFGKPSVSRKKMMGKSSIQLLVINGWLTFLFFYGVEKNIPEIREKALHFLEQIPSEKNTDSEQWSRAGVIAENALQSQALIHLKSEYCDKKRCLECRIGERILGEKID